MEYVFLVRDGINLSKLSQSGQCFRMNPTVSGKFRVVSDEHCALVSQEPYRFGSLLKIQDASDDDLYDYWHKYFDLDTNYGVIRSRIDASSDAVLSDAAQDCFGLKILNQDLWETLITFIISQNRNIAAIRNSVELLCNVCGETRYDSMGVSYTTFPSCYDILEHREEIRDMCKLGYRYDYVIGAAEMIGTGGIHLDQLHKESDSDLLLHLQRFQGIGPKVASCIALFGYHRLNVLPIDTWMKRILETYYPNGFPYDEYSPYCGVYQQYLFDYLRGNKELVA